MDHVVLFGTMWMPSQLYVSSPFLDKEATINASSPCEEDSSSNILRSVQYWRGGALASRRAYTKVERGDVSTLSLFFLYRHSIATTMDVQPNQATTNPQPAANNAGNDAGLRLDRPNAAPPAPGLGLLGQLLAHSNSQDGSIDGRLGGLRVGDSLDEEVEPDHIPGINKLADLGLYNTLASVDPSRLSEEESALTDEELEKKTNNELREIAAKCAHEVWEGEKQDNKKTKERISSTGKKGAVLA